MRPCRSESRVCRISWMMAGTVDAWLSILVLGALGTGVAYIMNFNVIRAAGAQTASMVTYLVPVFAVVFGVSILGEEISWHEPVGAVLIIAGVALSQGLLRRPKARVPAAAAPSAHASGSRPEPGRNRA